MTSQIDGSATGAVVRRIERELLFSQRTPRWLDDAAKRLEDFLADDARREDFRSWLVATRTAPPAAEPQGPSANLLSSAMLDWLRLRGLTFPSRAAALARLTEIVESQARISSESCALLVALGLQYVVFRYLPGPREFRGAVVHSNLLAAHTASGVRHSFRIPHNRGAANWMSAYLLDPRYKQDRKVVALADAAIDLRGRVASEDLVCGNRSVVGFVITQQPIAETPEQHSGAAIVGYFFVSHPVPGLFSPVSPDKGHVNIEAEIATIRERHEAVLASVIQSDLLVEFGQYAATERSLEWTAERGAPPMTSLSSTSPTGFLAAIRSRPSATTHETPGAPTAVDIQINEWPYLTALWGALHVMSLLFDDWAEGAARHMDAFARLATTRVGGHGPCAAWVPQYRMFGEAAPTFPDVGDYYPPEVSRALDTCTQPMTWCEWHRNAAIASGVPIETPFLRRVESALKIYSGPQRSYTDLVIPVRAGDGDTAAVAGFIRINCTPLEARPRISEAPMFQALYQVIHRFTGSLDASLGIVWKQSDEELRAVPRRAPLPIRRYKEMSDALGLLADWVARALATAFAGTSDIPPFHIVRDAYAHIGPFGEPVVDAQLLRKTQVAVSALAEAVSLERQNLPEVPVVTCWLMRTTPEMHLLPDAASGTPPHRALADLFARDPGLPEVLTYLSCYHAWPQRPWDLLPIDLLSSRLPIDVNGDVIEVGVPPLDTGLTSLTVCAVPAEGDRQGLRLDWSLPDGTLETATLLWTWGTNPGAIGHPFPGALQPVPWKVSRRVGALVASQTLVSVSPPCVTEGGPVGPQPLRRVASLNEEGARKIGLLEEAMGTDVGWLRLLVDNSRNQWILVLVSRHPTGPVVDAVRSTALSYERAAQLAWMLGEDHYQARTMARERAAVSHAFTGPLAAFLRTIGHANLVWGGQAVLKRQDVLQTMQDLIQQGAAIVALGRDAIQYAVKTGPSPARVTGEDLNTAVQQVLQAFRSGWTPWISYEAGAGRSLRSFSGSLVMALFRHGVAKLLANAVSAAWEVPDKLVSVTLTCERSLARLRIANTGVAIDGTRLSAMIAALRQGVLTQEGDDERLRLGLLEAGQCFQRLEVEVEMAVGRPPYALEVELRINAAR